MYLAIYFIVEIPTIVPRVPRSWDVFVDLRVGVFPGVGVWARMGRASEIPTVGALVLKTAPTVAELPPFCPVSYTHLTLPTIYSV